MVGIPTTAPTSLATCLHSFPTILYIYNQNPIPSYSKASWGLSVQLRVMRIFTHITTSPSLPPRQHSDHYAIRAGQNLPDKEFRYLRTVIVTAAVHRGFSSMLAHLSLTFRHRAGVRPYTSPCGFAEPCVFDKQSPPPGLCPSQTLLHEARLSRSYACNLPSSFNIVLSSALVYST